MKKTLLILGLFIAIAFSGLGVNSVQAETSTWNITSQCIHDVEDVCLGEQTIEPYVVTIIARSDEGDYGTISTENDEIDYSLSKLYDTRKVANASAFYFEARDGQGVDCLVAVIFYVDDYGSMGLSLSAKYPDKTLYWVGEMLELSDPEIET